MAAARIAVEILREYGARTRSRLEALVAQYAEVYGEDPAPQIAEALGIARRIVIGFDDDR